MRHSPDMPPKQARPAARMKLACSATHLLWMYPVCRAPGVFLRSVCISTRHRCTTGPQQGRREFPRRRYLGRNPRIPFTSVQVSALEAQFAVTRYLSGAQVHSIAVALGLTDTRVKIWFQNRRAREKRERQPYHLTEHGSTAAQSAALGASLAAETVRLTPTMGFNLSRPLHERLHSPTVLAPSGLETVSTRQVSLNRSGTNFFPPFGYWPALSGLQWSTQASDSLP
nr:homeobox protein MSX-1-like isoform X1 [Dermacentor andersoni]